MSLSPSQPNPSRNGDLKNPAQLSKSRRQRMVSGYSLMARGEPFVWLSGGMMVVCLAMLVLLLTIILWQGLLTFWPKPVRMLPLHDGTVVAGEWQWDETYLASNTSEISSDNAELSTRTPSSNVAANTRIAPQHRQFLRTGCAEYYGKHFRYIDDSECEPNQFLLPADYWSIERRKGGRFYGLIHQLREDFPATSTPALIAIQWLRSAEHDPTPPPVSESTETSQSVFDQLYREQWLQAYQTWTARADNASWRYANTEPNPNDPQTTSRFLEDTSLHPACLREWIQESRQWHSQADALQQAIAAEDRSMNRARLAVKDAEIAAQADWSGDLDASTRAIADACERCNHLLRTRESLDLLLAIGDPKDPTSVAANHVQELQRQKERLKAWRTTVEQALEREQAKLDPLTTSLPDGLQQLSNSAKTCVERYFKVVREATSKQLQWKEKLLQMESLQLTRHAVAAIPALDKATLLAEQLDGNAWQKLQSGDSTTLVTLAPELCRDMTEARTIGSNEQGQLWLIQTATSEKLVWICRNQQQQLLGFHFTDQTQPVGNMVRAFRPNALSLWGKIAIYGSRWWEFVSDDPRDANTEGGVFPAIWGTIVMTLIMSLVVVPFGVMASLYLREYAKAGPLVSLIRICINNLAGVPSIVYGVFGLAFFCYTVGGFIDGGPKRIDVTPLPPATWYALLGIIAVIGFIAFFLSLKDSAWLKKPNDKSTWRRTLATGLWLTCTGCVVYLIAKSPFFDGFFQASLPTPTYGKGALVWAALTLALLTLPVVIVATEEALSAVPNSLREGSYACGASKWQTIYRIVLPHARPGIMTGSILAMARGAGEVAPLMLVGAIPSALDLPLDAEFPFFHGSRSFMHLGFQIYSMGFQSQNSEAARPMVFTTTLLLIMIVAMLNFVAIWLRARLRKNFAGSQF